MRKSMILITALFVISAPVAEAQNKEITPRALLDQVDVLNDDFDKKIGEMNKEFEVIDTRFDNLFREVRQMDAVRQEFNKKYAEIIQIEADFTNFQEKWTDYLQENAKLRESIRSLEKEISNLRNETQISKEVVRWVTIIVTLVTAFFGVIFSRLILKMYGNYRVLAYKNKLNEDSEKNGI